MSTPPSASEEPITLEHLRAELRENTRITKGIADTLIALSQHVGNMMDAANAQGAATFRLRTALREAGQVLVAAGGGSVIPSDEELLLGGNGRRTES